MDSVAVPVNDTTVIVAVISALGIVLASWVGARHGGKKAGRVVVGELATGNGHTAGEALANIEKKVGGIAMMQAEQAASLQGVERRLATQGDLLAEHLVEVGPLIRQFKNVRERVMGPDWKGEEA